MSNSAEIILEHDFHVSQAVLWGVLTSKPHIEAWWMPGHQANFISFDLSEGGGWLNAVNFEGVTYYDLVRIEDIKTGRKISWHHSPSDENGLPIDNQWTADYPRTLLTTFELEPFAEGFTKLRLSNIPFNATAAEEAVFLAHEADLRTEWESAFAVMDRLALAYQSE